MTRSSPQRLPLGPTSWRFGHYYIVYGVSWRGGYGAGYGEGHQDDRCGEEGQVFLLREARAHGEGVQEEAARLEKIPVG